jgi:ABC-type sugar transport system substrate-binding protein
MKIDKNLIHKLKIALYKILLLIFSSQFHNNAYPISVSFINPGKSDEDFWVNSGKFTQAAAKNLGINLEVLYAQRDRIYMVKLAEEISKRKIKPDFVFIVNEKLAAEQMLPILNSKKIKTFLIHADLTNDQKKVLGHPREKLKYWIATIIPDNANAGYLIAEEIFKTAKKKINTNSSFNMIAIDGDKATPTSIERENGLKHFLNENKNINLKQTLSAEWSKDVAYEQTNVILDRYKNINMVWAANDPIALGVLKSAKEKGRNPGNDIFIGGLNWLKEAILEVKKGDLATTVGGHFMNGACALIVLYDYTHGIDLKKKNYELNIKIFNSINSRESDEFLNYLNESNWSKIDFKRFSKSLNSGMKSYDFNSKEILRTIKK